MTSADTRTELDAPAGYRLGDPIALEDLLALPPDGRRYARDEAGRLTLMSPDDARRHRGPLVALTARLNRALAPPWWAGQEPSIAFDPLYARDGRRLGPSRLGRRAIEPDLAVFADRPRPIAGDPERTEAWTVYAPDGLRLVVELVSPGTWRDDVGAGEADRVDRWRTYLENGVPEYWVLNAGFEGLAVPTRAGLFLRSDGEAWASLEGEGLRRAEAPVRGVRPVLGGRVASPALGGFALDLDAFWAEACG